MLLDDGRLIRLDASGAPAGEVRLADDIGRAAAMAPGGETIVAASQSAREVNAWVCDGDGNARRRCSPRISPARPR